MAPSRKNESKSLKLNSPVGAEPAYFKWPLESHGSTNEGSGSGGNEIVEIMKSVCEDYPELALPIKNHIIKDFDSTNYDSVKSCCDKFNRAIAQINLLFSGTYRPGKQRANPSRKLLKHIIQLSYNRAVDDVEKLNEYEPFSPQVYGETSFDLICKMLDDVPVKETDTFIDLGSGVGQVVLQVAALTNCKMCYGIEKSQICVEYAGKLESEFRFWMNWYGKVFTDFELIKGDFMDDNYASIITNCSFIFVNNFAFGPAVDHQLKLRFQHLHDGTRIVASKAFAPIKFRASGRNMSDIASIMRVSELASLKGSVSWTENPVSYYLHIIDTTLLESFFEQQKLKSSSRSGSDDTASERTDSCESNVGGRSDVESPPAQPETVTQPEPSTSKTNKETTSKSPSKKATTPAGKVVRKYPRRSSRKNLLGPAHTATNASDSSSSTSSGFDKKPLAHYSSERKKAADTLSPVATTTPSRGRATRRKPVKKTQAQSTPEKGSKTRGGSPAAKHRKTSPRGNTSSLTESGLEMLHSHSIASTKQDTAPLFTDGPSPVETSSKEKKASGTYKELNVKVEDLEAMSVPTTGTTSAQVTSRENPPSGPRTEEAVGPFETTSGNCIPGLDDLMASMKNRYVEFIEQMQTSEYAEMLQEKIQEERLRGHMLRNKVDEVRTEIRELEKEFVQIFNSRLKELGIHAETPAEFVDKAKSIITIHEALRVRTREEQELYNKEYELLQRNIEARRVEYEELSMRLQREQGTALPPFDVNMILSLKQNATAAATLSAASSGTATRLSANEVELAPPNRILELTPVEMLKRGDIVDLETLIATQLQNNSDPVQPQQQLFRIPSSQGNSSATVPATVLIVCKGCGTPSTQKHIAQSPNGLCIECDAKSTSPRNQQHHQLIQRSMDSNARNSISDLAELRAASTTPGRTNVAAVGGSCFSIDNLVSPSRLHQASDSILISGTSQHSSVSAGNSGSAAYCLPLSATLSSPILRAGLTNPQQKLIVGQNLPPSAQISLDSIDKHEDKGSSAPMMHDSSSSISSSRMRNQSPAVARQPLSFPKFEEYNRKRGTWDPASAHGKPSGYTALESINNLVEKVAATTYKLSPEEQEDLCYKCILIGYLPVELRPEWEDPKASHGSDYSTPIKSNSAASNLSNTMAHSSNPTSHGHHHSSLAHSSHTSTASMGLATHHNLPSSTAISPISFDHNASHKYSAGTSTAGVGALNLLASVSTKAMSTGSSHSYQMQKSGGGPSSVASVTSNSSQSSNSQWESNKMRTESQDRINSVISQVLKSSTQTMHVFSPTSVQAEISFAKVGPVVEIESMESKRDSVDLVEPMDQTDAAPTGSQLEPSQQKFETRIEGRKEETREEEFPHDDQCSQSSSLNASTIAGEREPESANVSMCSGTDDSATSQADTEDAMETELDPPHYAEETESRQDMETESIPLDDKTQQNSSNSKRVASEDKVEVVSTVSAVSSKEEPGKQSKEIVVEKSSGTKQPRAFVTDSFSHSKSHNEGPRIKLAITKKDVAKQFQAIDAAAKEASSLALAAPKLSLESKGLEVITAELPAQLLTESKEAVVEQEHACKDEEGIPLATSSPQKQAIQTEMHDDRDKEVKEEGGDGNDGNHKSVAKAEKTPTENESTKFPANETRMDQAATNFDFSQVNFDNTDFVDDDDRKP